MKKLPPKIILIGMKYAGKTTLGKPLAQQLNLPFIDLDRVIEADYATLYGYHKTCRQIWNSDGEENFRWLEEEALEQICTHQGLSSFLLATGGGAILSEKNRQLLKRPQHLILYLQISEQQLLTNFLQAEKKDISEPLPSFLSSKQDPQLLLRELLQQRHPLYTSLANLIVKNEGSLQESVEKIASQLTL